VVVIAASSLSVTVTVAGGSAVASVVLDLKPAVSEDVRFDAVKPPSVAISVSNQASITTSLSLLRVATAGGAAARLPLSLFPPPSHAVTLLTLSLPSGLSVGGGSCGVVWCGGVVWCEDLARAFRAMAA